MSRSILTAMLLAILLASAPTSMTFPAASAESRCAHPGPATGHGPTDVQMDRDFADVPRTQIASPISAALPRVVSATIVTVQLIAPALTTEQRSAIIEQQHVFRI